MKLIIAILMITNIAFANKQSILMIGDKAPYEGLLIDTETFQYLKEKIDRIDGAEAALIKQNDMLIEIQNQKITLEFERDAAHQKFEQHKWTTGVLWILVGILAAGHR